MPLPGNLRVVCQTILFLLSLVVLTSPRFCGVGLVTRNPAAADILLAAAFLSNQFLLFLRQTRLLRPLHIKEQRPNCLLFLIGHCCGVQQLQQ